MSRSSKSDRTIRLCVITTIAKALYYYSVRQFPYLQRRGFGITGVATRDEYTSLLNEMGVETVDISIARKPRPFRDLISLVRLWWFFLWHRFDVIFVSTPKAGLLGGLAARMTLQPRVLYVLRGRPYENMTGLRLKLFRFIESIACRTAKVVVPICRELAEAIVAEGICPAGRIRMIGSGSSKGVDLSTFTPTPERVEQAARIRQRFGIGARDRLILYVGYIRGEKGIDDLMGAFRTLSGRHPDLHLLLVGSYEPLDPIREESRRLIEDHDRIHRLEWMDDPAPAYAAADVFAFPSYREGFGNVALEAAAMEVPVVASDVMGCREGVLDGRTGLLVPPRCPEELARGLERLLGDSLLREEMGRAARERVEREFRQEILFEGTAQLCEELAGRRKRASAVHSWPEAARSR